MENSLFKLKSPLKVTLNVTNKCNFRCIHCYNDSMETLSEKELNTQEIKKLLNDLKKIGTIIVSINGGEPLIRKDIFEILKEANKLGFIINLNTNGSLINEAVARKLAKLNINNIDVSLHTDNEFNFYKFTKSKLFKSTLNGIKNLIDVGISPGIAFVVTSINIEWAKNIVKIISNLGVNSMHTIVLVQRGRAINNNLAVQMKDLKKAYQKIIKIGKKYKINLSLECPFNLYDGLITKKENNIKMDVGCFGGRYLICVQANGDVTPCALYPSYIVGNIKKQSINKIWNGPDMKSFNNLKKNDNCTSCNIFELCHGGCPASSFSPNEIIPDPLCPKIKNI